MVEMKVARKPEQVERRRMRKRRSRRRWRRNVGALALDYAFDRR